MYDAVAAPYCYEGTEVLRNIPGIRYQAALDAFEAVSTTQRSDEPLPTRRLSVRRYQAIHRHLFQEPGAPTRRRAKSRTGQGDHLTEEPDAARPGREDARRRASGAARGGAREAVAGTHASYPQLMARRREIVRATPNDRPHVSSLRSAGCHKALPGRRLPPEEGLRTPARDRVEAYRAWNHSTS